ncbi:MAG: hypothetical protein M9947_15595 [Thermomicrobiales bacterium]|nr:hypothetical protein [Thermomicrobiales bacterium]
MNSIPARSTRCRFGVATRDATPPLDAYGRWWGAALHDQKRGVHRPLQSSAAVFAPVEGEGDPLVLVTIDNCVFRPPDDQALRAAIRKRAGLPDANLLLSPSHSHSSANINTALTHLPGGDQAQPFLDYSPGPSATRSKRRVMRWRPPGSPGAPENAHWPESGFLG